MPSKKPRTPFNILERLLQRIPTWLFVSAEVAVLGFIAVWVEDGDKVKSMRDVVRVVFQNAEPIAIAAAVILYFKEIPARKAQKHYDAWQVIDNASAARVSTSYARFKALEDLNNDGVSLSGINIPNANLQGINLQWADLSNADLRGADLTGANLTGADLRGANLSNATLFYTTCNDAVLIDANFTGANLNSADFTGADFTGANLTDTNLIFATLANADLMLANLSNADLMLTNLNDADLTDTDFCNAKRLLPQQVKQAKHWEQATYDPDICKTLGLPPKPDK